MTRIVNVACWLLVLGLTLSASARAQSALPTLAGPVNDFAQVIDSDSARELDRVIRQLQSQTGDAIIVATVPTIEPYGDIADYAVKLFENGGRGIGERGKDNGVLVVVALNERRVRVEVGYGLEEWITDGYAGQLSRDVFTPAFREGRYGAGLVAGVTQIATRIAQGRNVTLTGVEAPPLPREAAPRTQIPSLVFIVLVILALSWFNRRPPGGRRSWGNDGWSGWSSGVGPFGGGYYGGRGGFGGGFGGGGFGGGFGGFGGGRSGGGGGGSSW